jgi:hypothetical protein
VFERLVRRHERRAREAFAAALERAVAEVDEPLCSRSAHRSELPPGTLPGCARAILLACDGPMPRPEPAELVWS